MSLSGADVSVFALEGAGRGGGGREAAGGGGGRDAREGRGIGARFGRLCGANDGGGTGGLEGFDGAGREDGTADEDDVGANAGAPSRVVTSSSVRDESGGRLEAGLTAIIWREGEGLSQPICRFCSPGKRRSTSWAIRAAQSPADERVAMNASRSRPSSSAVA